MKRIYQLLCITYVTFAPVLAMLIQGGLDHEFMLGFVPAGMASYFSTVFYFYVIAMLLMLSFMVYQDGDSRTMIGILASGPLAGLLIAWVTGGKPIHAAYHMYLIEGGSFIVVLLVQLLRHVRRIAGESGRFAPLGLALLLGSFLGGFLRSINLEFLVSLYPGWLGYLCLAAALAVSIASFYRMLDHIDEAHGRSRYGAMRRDDVRTGPGEPAKSYDTGGPLILVSAMVGFLALAFLDKLLESDWLMSWIR